MSSKVNWVFSALLAAAASSSPAQSIGPGTIQFMLGSQAAPFAEEITCDNHHLSAVLIIEAMFPLAGEDMGGNLGNVLNRVNSATLTSRWYYPEGYRSKLVPGTNRQRKHCLFLRLRSV